MKFMYVVLLLATSSIGVIYCLFSFAMVDDDHKNGFERNIALLSPTVSKTLDLQYNSFYIAGKTDHHVYLGNIVAPGHLISVAVSSFDTTHITLRVNNPKSVPLGQIRVEVDSPYFYFSDGSAPAIFTGTLASGKADPILNDRIPFIDAKHIHQNNFALICLNPARERKLAKLTPYPYAVSFPPSPFVKQIDGLFCTDGKMHFRDDIGQLIYLYSYRNEYLVLDENLEVIAKGNTIDTTTHAQIEISTITSKNAKTFSSPPRLVNRQSAIEHNLMFVNSAIQADNESEEKFKDHSAIDIYDLDTRRYILSFYIPTYRGERLRHFVVAGMKLVALYKYDIVSYQLEDVISSTSN